MDRAERMLRKRDCMLPALLILPGRGRPPVQRSALPPGHPAEPASNSPWIMLAVAGAVAVLIAAYGGVQPQWYLPLDLVPIGLTLAVLVHAVWRRKTLARHGTLPALLALLLLPPVQIVLRRSVDRAATEVVMVPMLAAGAVLFLGFHAGRGSRVRHRLLVGLALAGALLATEGILQKCLSANLIYGLHAPPQGTPMGPYVDRDDFAAAVNLMFPAALVLSLRPRRGLFETVGWGLPAALMMAAVMLSQSRAGVGVMALEAGAGLWLLRRRESRPARAGAGSPGRAALLLLAMLAGAAMLTGSVQLGQRFQRTRLAANARSQLWLSSLAMGWHRPWLGWGAGTWADVYPGYARFDDGERFRFAHNEYVQWWAESGVAGICLGGWLLATLLAGLRVHAPPPTGDPAVPREPPGEGSSAPVITEFWPCDGLAWACRLALAGLALHCGVEFLLHIPSVSLLAGWLAGLQLGRSRQWRPDEGLAYRG